MWLKTIWLKTIWLNTIWLKTIRLVTDGQKPKPAINIYIHKFRMFT